MTHHLHLFKPSVRSVRAVPPRKHTVVKFTRGAGLA